MNILFVGQLGIGFGAGRQPSPAEVRVPQLATHWAALGHRVEVLCPRNRLTLAATARHQDVTLRFLPSLTRHPNSWLPLLHTLFIIWKQQPDAVHVHGWRAAAVGRFMTLLSPETTFVWTIDTLPLHRPRLSRLIARYAQQSFDAISTPTRQLQYLLLHHYGLRTWYTPDGYAAATAPLIPLKHFSLRKGQYALTFCSSENALKAAVKSFQALSTKKKLVVIGIASAPNTERLLRKYPFLHLIDYPAGRRVQHSLIDGAAVVVLGDEYVATEQILLAMAAGKPIVAVAAPRLEETLGTTAQFFRAGDQPELARSLAAVISDRTAQARWGQKSRRRARCHFRLKRTMADYLMLYRLSTVRHVPLDSAGHAVFTQLPA